MEDKELTVGCTYYRLTFADRDLTMPGVEPLVYLGEASLENGRSMLAFQDTVSYVHFGSALGQPEQNDEIVVHLIERTEIGSGVLDVDAVAQEVSAAALRADNLGRPVLPVLRKGWKSAS